MAAADLSIIIPTWQAASVLPRLLQWCRDYCSDAEIIVTDGGSTDETAEIAGQFGAHFMTGALGRGSQCSRGVAASTRPWILILHADSQPAADFASAINNHQQHYPGHAGYGWLRFDSTDWRAAVIAYGANIRSAVFGLPYGDQAILIPRALYDQAGGYPDWPLMEDVELARRLKKTMGKNPLKPLKSYITTDAVRYQRDGYGRRVIRNLSCLLAYFNGVPAAVIAARYHGQNP